MALRKLYYARAKGDFEITTSEVLSSFLTVDAAMLILLVKYFSLEQAVLLSHSLTLAVSEMHSTPANVGLWLYFRYIMTYIFNFITEKEERKKSSREYLIIIQVVLLD